MKHGIDYWRSFDSTPKPTATVVAEPETKDRRFVGEEQRLLQSAIAKSRSSRDDYTWDEILALWRNRYFTTFLFDDPDVASKAEWKKAVRAIETRAEDWGESRSGMRKFLVDTLRWWADQLDAKKAYPSGPPHLVADLLTKTRGGAYRHFAEWRGGGKRR